MQANSKAANNMLFSFGLLAISLVAQHNHI
jgi:hypothetical protein